MTTQFYSIAIISLLAAMSPGPDFALVAKNSIVHSKRSGYFTSLGVGTATLVHMTYCLLGLAIIISQSIFLFNSIKYAGACYLIYLGLKTICSERSNKLLTHKKTDKKPLSDIISFRQGFFCNLLNPKVTLFFLALFTAIIDPETPVTWELAYGVEISFIITTWFCILTSILSHPYIKRTLEKAEKYIVKILGTFLIGLGVALAFVRR